MNKKMKEIYAKIQKLNDLANEYLENGDAENAEKTIKDIEDLEREYVIAEKLYNREKGKITDKDIDDALQAKKASGFAVIAKLMKGKALTDVENAIVVEGEPTENGTNYLIPEDVRTEIREKRKSYKSAKELVNVIPVTTLSGSTNFEKDDDGLLDDFTDGAAISESNNPGFERAPWAIKWKGKLIYISNIVLGNEKASLMAYLDKWFIRKAVRTENKDIFDTLKKNKKTVAIKGLDSLKEHITKNIDPSCLVDGVIVTNQTGFALMDAEKDNNGRGMLQPNPMNATEKMFQSLPIKVFADKELANVEEGKAAMFVGSTKAGCDFMEREDLQFAISEHFAFNKNQTTLRVMEGYDVVQADKDAYSYVSFEQKEAEEKQETKPTGEENIPEA